MLRSSPIKLAVKVWLFLSCAFVFAAACSGDDGSELEGGTDPDPIPPGPPIVMGGSGNQGGASSTCSSIEGLSSCSNESVTAQTAPANVLLVLDKSGSMSRKPEADIDVTLWEATKTALGNALAETNDAVSFGLELFPWREGQPIALDCYPNCCEMDTSLDMNVPIESGDETRDAILNALETTSPGGGTPTATALERAYRYFSEGDGADLEGGRFVLLATDGGPNCDEGLSCGIEQCTFNIDGQCPNEDTNCCATNTEGCLDDQGTLGQIEKLRDLGVGTFVIGLFGSERYATQLDRFAEAGGFEREGTAHKYFRVDAEGTAEGLTDVLQEITRRLVQRCDLQLAEAPHDITRVNVAVDCSVVPYLGESGEGGSSSGEGGHAGRGGTSSTDDGGWRLDESTSPPTVRLEGAICDRIETEGAERIDVVYGCPTLL